jgi:Tfp pilus assembly protein PilN
MYDFIEVNLLPAEYRVRKRAIRLEPWIVYPSLIVALIGAGLLVYAGVLRKDVVVLENRIRQLEAQIRAKEPIEQEIKRLSEEKKVFVGKIMALERITVNRAKWVRLLETFCRCLPEYMWLVSFKEVNEPEPRLMVQGKTRSFAEVATYMSELKQSSFITEVELSKIEQVDDKDRVYGFEVTCTIDPNAGLTTVE